MTYYLHNRNLYTLKISSFIDVSPIRLNYSRPLSGKCFEALFEVFWGDGLPDHSRHFFDPLSSLHLDVWLQKDSTNQ